MFGDATALYERARNWTVGSDPGLLRLRMATRTTGALATALLVLFLLTKATGQPLTVALLGALITMVSARSVNEPDPRRQRITMALLPLPTALAITAAALVSPHPVIADVLFVVVVFAAAYVRRFGPRGTALGMVTFMSYFFSLYLRAKFSELPWLIGATLVGTLCSFVWSAFLMPDRPESVLRENIRALRARMAIVVDTTADIVRIGHPDERRRRRLRIRTRRLNETALLVQAQIEDRVNPECAVAGGQRRGPRAVVVRRRAHRRAARDRPARRAAIADIPAATRAELADTVAMLSRAHPDTAHRRPPADRGRALSSSSNGHPDPDDCRCGAWRWRSSTRPKPPPKSASGSSGSRPEPPSNRNPVAPSVEQQFRPGMLPSTRQAIQVAVAAALAIVVGETISPSHWYWAAIAAFVIFAGTNSWAETLDKGWQRSARHGARCAQRRAGRHAGVRQHHRLAGDDLRMSVLRFLFHEGHLQPDDLLDQHHAGVDVRPARRIHLHGLLLLRIEETAVGAVTRDRRRRAGIADQHPSEDPRRRPHVFPDAVRSRRDSVTSLLGTPAPARVDRDGTSTRPRPGAVPDHRQADERRSRRTSRAPQPCGTA